MYGVPVTSVAAGVGGLPLVSLPDTPRGEGVVPVTPNGGLGRPAAVMLPGVSYAAPPPGSALPVVEPVTSTAFPSAPGTAVLGGGGDPGAASCRALGGGLEPDPASAEAMEGGELDLDDLGLTPDLLATLGSADLGPMGSIDGLDAGDPFWQEWFSSQGAAPSLGSFGLGPLPAPKPELKLGDISSPDSALEVPIIKSEPGAE